MKQLLRSITPPIVITALSRARNRGYGFSGDFSAFAAAQALTVGYGAPEIVQAAREPTPSIDVDARLQQILAALALVPQRPLSVLDLGGASGGYYYLLRPFMDLRWTVLETPAMVAANRHRSTEELTFIDAPEDAAPGYDIVFMSGVLQYLELPFAMFGRLAPLAQFVLINRLPLIETSRDRITVQRVHPSIYRGSYPAWFFSRESFMAVIERQHEVAMRWDVPQDAPLLDGKPVVYKGLLLKRRQMDAHGLRPFGSTR